MNGVGNIARGFRAAEHDRGCRVSMVDRALFAADRRDIHDSSKSARDHRLHDGLVDVKGRVQIDVDHARPFVGGVVGERRVRTRDARAVHEHVDRAEARDGCIGGLLHGLALRDVHRERRYVAELREALLRGGERRFVAVLQRDARAAL